MTEVAEKALGLKDLFDRAPVRKIISRSWSKRAAVNLIVDDVSFDTAAVLMIQRARYEGDPWSGHMAFPGGRQEKVDISTLETAKRETFEELGFDMDAPISRRLDLRFLGRLSDRYARQRGNPIHLVITPYVFSLRQRPALTLNYEVADTFWIPLKYFADFRERKQFSFSYAGKKIALPCYQYGEEQRVWGLSLEMIDELLRWQGCDVPATETLAELT